MITVIVGASNSVIMLDKLQIIIKKQRFLAKVIRTTDRDLEVDLQAVLEVPAGRPVALEVPLCPSPPADRKVGLEDPSDRDLEVDLQAVLEVPAGRPVALEVPLCPSGAAALTESHEMSPTQQMDGSGTT